MTKYPVNKHSAEAIVWKGPTDNKQLVLGITAVNCLQLLV